MALVIFNSIQYDDSRLPSHVDPKECVPLEAWRKKNRQVEARPKPKRPKASDKPAAT